MARNRRGGGDGGDDSSRWLTTYGDTVTLLLAFFVMLFAISQVDVRRFELLVSGLREPFKNEGVVEGILNTGNGIVGPTKQAEPQQPQPGVKGLDVMFDSPAVPGFPEGESDTPGHYLGTIEELEEVREALATALAAAGVETSVRLDLDTRGLVVSIATDEVLFPTGSAEVQPAGREILAVMAPVLASFDNAIRVEGHTDTVPLNRNGYTNWNLSADRALAVLDILLDQGLNPRRLSATGYGEYRPIAPNDTPEGRQRNRRVELVIVAETPPED